MLEMLKIYKIDLKNINKILQDFLLDESVVRITCGT